MQTDLDTGLPQPTEPPVTCAPPTPIACADSRQQESTNFQFDPEAQAFDPHRPQLAVLP